MWAGTFRPTLETPHDDEEEVEERFQRLYEDASRRQVEQEERAGRERESARAREREGKAWCFASPPPQSSVKNVRSPNGKKVKKVVPGAAPRVAPRVTTRWNNPMEHRRNTEGTPGEHRRHPGVDAAMRDTEGGPPLGPLLGF